MVLCNKDGIPTECARLLAVYHRVIESLAPGARYFEVLGDEWKPAQMAIDDLLAVLVRSPRNTHYGWVWYGSVTNGGRKIGSSTGRATWIDDLLDALIDGPSVSRLHEMASGLVERDEIADLIVRGAFLCAATRQPLEFTLDHLLTGKTGPGWKIAEAWCLAQNQPTTPAGGPIARAMVAQSQAFRRALRRTVDEHDPASLAAFLLRLAEACLDAPEPGPAAVPVLRCTLNSLGFLAGAQDRHSASARDASLTMVRC
jgi:arginyl-tRNA synthetase